VVQENERNGKPASKDERWYMLLSRLLVEAFELSESERKSRRYENQPERSAAKAVVWITGVRLLNVSPPSLEKSRSS
jgi:hypothetical protein